MPDLVRTVQAARQDRSLAVLEGFHAVKHALRFGARLELLVSPDPDALHELAAELAPDVSEPLRMVEEVDAVTWGAMGAEGLPTPALAVAPRPQLPPRSEGAAVLLEDPRHLGNVGACIRVAAAAGAAAVRTTGDADPWHPSAIRAAAGLHYAVAVEGGYSVDRIEPPLVAVDPEGRPLHEIELPQDVTFAFGTERHGLSAHLRDRCDARVAIPMRPGVSSLNLATSVAVVLYAHRGLGR